MGSRMLSFAYVAKHHCRPVPVVGFQGCASVLQTQAALGSVFSVLDHSLATSLHFQVGT